MSGESSKGTTWSLEEDEGQRAALGWLRVGSNKSAVFEALLALRDGVMNVEEDLSELRKFDAEDWLAHRDVVPSGNVPGKVGPITIIELPN